VQTEAIKWFPEFLSDFGLEQVGHNFMVERRPLRPVRVWKLISSLASRFAVQYFEIVLDHVYEDGTLRAAVRSVEVVWTQQGVHSALPIHV
jgi:hypothetical protein